ncbi:MAG: tetratricopeptide repeat protein [Leptolyngbyaceae cyanobacterium SM1_3_5]|nr:tetratricopeptide repeat protein [Leptolyngbyaceae cyanobacterium SM1_3_5]
MQTGTTAFQAGDFAAALTAFSQAIDQDSSSAAAYGNRCLTYIQLNSYPQAIEDCNQAIVLNPKLAEAYLNRGLAHYRLGQAAAAIEDYSQLLQLTRSDYRAYYNRGLARVELGQYREALVDYGEALRQAPLLDRVTQAEIHTDRGLVLLMLKNPHSAVADLTQAIHFNPTDRAYYNRACACQQQGNRGGAVRDFSEVIARVPDYAEAYWNRGLLLYQQGDRDQAIADLQQAARYFGERGEAIAHQQVLNLLDKLQVVEAALV